MINFCQPLRKFRIKGRIYTAKLPVRIAQRQSKLLLHSKLNIRNAEHIEVEDSDGPGNCVMIRLCGSERTIVFTSFGKRAKPSEEVINEVVNLAEQFLACDAAVDRFLADQLVIYMAIAQAGSFTTNEISSHLQTNMEVIKKFLPIDFNVESQEQACRISCQSL
jgi:RNA 3'-terminal phosphate cyclase (ATP)